LDIKSTNMPSGGQFIRMAAGFGNWHFIGNMLAVVPIWCDDAAIATLSAALFPGRQVVGVMADRC
jgi:agmatine/peptidylarginine deiminase